MESIVLVISVPKTSVNGQFYFNLSSKTWSRVFLEHSVYFFYFVIFKLKVLAYTCINHSGDGAD